jgi:long-chain acyl-CoA synthetase
MRTVEAAQSVVEALGCIAKLHPSRDALVFGDRHVSYGELWSGVVGAAQELERSGIKPGERVLLAAPSVPAFAFAYFATHLTGATVVLLDPRAPAARRDALIERVGPALMIGVDAETRSVSTRTLKSIEGLGPRTDEVGPPASDDLADLLFTTGTTGRAKGVRLTHRNLIAAARHINATIGRVEGDVEVMPLPLMHSFGLGRLRCNLLAGATTVLVDGFRFHGELFEIMARHAATGFVGVPAVFAMMLRAGGAELAAFADRLRYVEIGSAPMPIEHKLALRKLLPRTALWMHYGLTEASRSTFVEFHRHGNHLHTAGLAAPAVQLSIRDESGVEQPCGQDGLIWIAGPHVSPGYWDDPELGTSTFREGWVCSGDVGHLDEEGFLHLRGRKDDMINVGGYIVSPDEVERSLVEHPSVLDAACVGVPDGRGVGVLLRAHVVQRPGSERPTGSELARWVAARLEPYKVPTVFLWEPQLPRTSSGKLTRSRLRGEPTTTSPAAESLASPRATIEIE